MYFSLSNDKNQGNAVVITLERVVRGSEWNNIYYLSVPEGDWATVSMRIIWSLRKQETEMPEMLRTMEERKKK